MTEIHKNSIQEMEDKAQKNLPEKQKKKTRWEKREKNIRESSKQPTPEHSRKLWEGNYERNNKLKFPQTKGQKFPDSEGPLVIQ